MLPYPSGVLYSALPCTVSCTVGYISHTFNTESPYVSVCLSCSVLRVSALEPNISFGPLFGGQLRSVNSGLVLQFNSASNATWDMKYRTMIQCSTSESVKVFSKNPETKNASAIGKKYNLACDDRTSS